MKTALLLMSHGSPRPAANADLYRIADILRERRIYDEVAVGFLECNEPSIADALDACAAGGVEQVVCVPYFLHEGNHVADDLPALLEAARLRHPDVAFLLTDFLGASPYITDILAARARAVR